MVSMSLSQYQPLPFRLWISDNRLVFKIKDGYKLELQMPETSTKKVIDEKLIEKMYQFLK